MPTKEDVRIDKILARYPVQRDLLLSALHDVQHRADGKTWITDQELARIAEHFDIPVAELDGIVSFYTMFARKLRGRHVIRLCDSLSCRICGSLDIYQHLREALGISAGMTTGDGEFSIEVVNCLGACDRAPNLMIDDELMSAVTPDSLDARLAALREAQE